MITALYIPGSLFQVLLCFAAEVLCSPQGDYCYHRWFFC